MKTLLSYCGKEILVDEEFYDHLKDYSWSLGSHGYACHQGKKTGLKRSVLLHRYLFEISGIELPKGTEVDHVNGNKLDNRFENLRVASSSQNKMNQRVRIDSSTGYRGVCYCKRDRAYYVKISVNGEHKNLGYFKDPEEAARVYNEAAIKYHGEFASLNRIPVLLPLSHHK